MLSRSVLCWRSDMVLMIRSLLAAKSTCFSSGISLLLRSCCASYGLPSHCSLGLCLLSLRPPAALARLAAVVAELTGCRGRDERRGGDNFGSGVMIRLGGLYLRLASVEGLLFCPLGTDCCAFDGDFDSLARLGLFDIADAVRGVRDEGEVGLGPTDCARLCVAGNSFLGTVLVCANDGVGMSVGMLCELCRPALVGAGIVRYASMSLLLRL
jgi:hypothetical protein